jgi:hypothetical protein
LSIEKREASQESYYYFKHQGSWSTPKKYERKIYFWKENDDNNRHSILNLLGE